MFQGEVFMGLGVLILICIYAGLIIIVISLIYKLLQFVLRSPWIERKDRLYEFKLVKTSIF